MIYLDLKGYRKRHNLSQMELAAKMWNTSNARISQLENEFRRFNVTLATVNKTVNKIAAKLDCDVMEILSVCDPDENTNANIQTEMEKSKEEYVQAVMDCEQYALGIIQEVNKIKEKKELERNGWL